MAEKDLNGHRDPPSHQAIHGAAHDVRDVRVYLASGIVRSDHDRHRIFCVGDCFFEDQDLPYLVFVIRSDLKCLPAIPDILEGERISAESMGFYLAEMGRDFGAGNLTQVRV